MAEMSPSSRVLMGVLRKGSWAAAALLMLFLPVFCCGNAMTPDGGLSLHPAAITGSIGAVVALFALAVYLVRAIGREMDTSGGLIGAEPQNAYRFLTSHVYLRTRPMDSAKRIADKKDWIKGATGDWEIIIGLEVHAQV